MKVPRLAFVKVKLRSARLVLFLTKRRAWHRWSWTLSNGLLLEDRVETFLLCVEFIAVFGT